MIGVLDTPSHPEWVPFDTAKASANFVIEKIRQACLTILMLSDLKFQFLLREGNLTKIQCQFQ